MVHSRLGVAGGPRRWPFVLLAALSVGYLADLFLSSRTLLMRDLFCDFLPWRLFERDALWAGRLPLWNPFGGHGKPFIADPQAAAFYPFHLPFYILPPPLALEVSWALHLWVAAVSMFSFARYWTLRTVPALAAGISFAFSTWLIAHMEFVSAFTTAAWGPLILWRAHVVVDQFARRPPDTSAAIWRRTRTRSVALLVAVTALQYTAGHPEQVLHTWMLTAVFLSIRGLMRRDLPTLQGVAALIGIAVPLALAAVLPLLLSSLELVRYSERAAAIDPGLAVASAHPQQWMSLLLPFAFGRPGHDNYWATTIFEFWAGTAYVGLLPLFLCSFAFSWLTRRQNDPLGRRCRELVVASMVVLVFGGLMASGGHAPLYPLLHEYAPWFDRVRWPTKYLLWVVYGLTLLAGAGYQGIVQAPRDQAAGDARPARAARGTRMKDHSRTRSRALKTQSHVFLRLRGYRGPLVCTGVAVLFICATYLVGAVPAWASRVARLSEAQLADAQRAVMVSAAWAVLGFAALLLRVTLYGGWTDAVMIAGIFLNLMVVGRQIHPVGDESVYRAVPDLAASVAAGPNAGRVHSEYAQTQAWLYAERDPRAFEWARAAGVGDAFLPFGIYHTWQGGLKLERYQHFYAHMGMLDGERRQQLADVAGIGFDITSAEGNRPAIRTPVKITPRPSALPRAYVVRQWTSQGATARSLETLAGASFDPRREGIIHSEVLPSNAGPSGMAEAINVARVTLDNGNMLRLNVVVQHRSLLVLSDTWYPGWTATVNGKRKPVLLVNYMFRGILLEPGTSHIEWVYAPWQLWYGVWFSAGVLIWIGYATFPKIEWKLDWARHSGSGKRKETD